MFRSVEVNPLTGKHPLTNNPLKAINSTNPITIPCGGCVGCRLDRADQLATRCMHEAQMHRANSFLTLTYDDKHLPEDYSVNKREVQLFMKRLRKHTGASKLRFLAVGEYGEQTLRPHYHLLIFGHDFSADRKLIRQGEFGNSFTSPALEKLWTFGMSELGSVTYKSAAYCARYSMKKISGAAAPTHYLRTHPKGHLVQVRPEFATQSTKPGLGSSWFDKYRSDCFPSDFLVIDGKHKPVPRYYQLKLQEDHQTALKRARKRKSLPHKWNSTPERLRVRETVKQSRLTQLKRELK